MDTMHLRPRVQVPAWSDDWMKGDRFGCIVNVTKRKGAANVEVAHILLDISNKVHRYLLTDCIPV